MKKHTIKKLVLGKQTISNLGLEQAAGGLINIMSFMSRCPMCETYSKVKCTINTVDGAC